MRISDWSLDVCSSDLGATSPVGGTDAVTSAVGGATGAATGAVSGAANGAANIAGSVAGQGAASGNAAGSNAAASGAGALDAAGNVATTVNPGMVVKDAARSEEHTSELQSLMRISYAVFCLKKKITK